VIGHDALRRIDRLVGVPLCALLSAARRLSGVLPLRHPTAQAMRRVLFVQLAESGSMVLADPAMRAVAARSGARLHCVTFAANRASLSLTCTLPDAQVFVLRTGALHELLTDAWRLLRWVRREQIDTVIDFELFSRLTAALCLLTGVRRRAGFHRLAGVGLYRGDLYSHPVGFEPQCHVAINYLRLVEAVLGADSPPDAALVPRLRLRAVAPDEFAAVHAKLAACLPGGTAPDARLVLVNANASAQLPQRRWPQAHFIALIEALLGHYPALRVLLIGAVEDRPTTAAIAAGVADPRCVEVAGRFEVAELPALFRLSAAMVSNDSGPAHFAAVTVLPVIVLFGPETPRLFRPLGNTTVVSAGLACSPCVHVGNQRRTRCSDNQCMKRISVGEVLAATRAVLDAPPQRAVRAAAQRSHAEFEA
jgi:ADP-heptose:LPS heptosyltransferase